MRCRSFLVFVIVCCSTLLFAETDSAKKYIITADRLNIRLRPVKKSRIIGSLKRGARVMLTRSKVVPNKYPVDNEYWYALPNGRGYLHGRYLVPYQGGQTVVDNKNGRVIFFNKYFKATVIVPFKSSAVVMREHIKKGNTKLQGRAHFQHVQMLSPDLFVVTDGVGMFRSEFFDVGFVVYRRSKKIFKTSLSAVVHFFAKQNLIAIFVYERAGLYEMKFTGKIVFLDGRSGVVKKQLNVLSKRVLISPGSPASNSVSQKRAKCIWDIGKQRVVIDLKNFSVTKR